jgi:hypothetical protein
LREVCCKPPMHIGIEYLMAETVCKLEISLSTGTCSGYIGNTGDRMSRRLPARRNSFRASALFAEQNVKEAVPASQFFILYKTFAFNLSYYTQEVATPKR